MEPINSKQKNGFMYNLDFYFVDRDICETNEKYIFRIDYIINNLNKNNNIQELIMKSRIEANIHFLNCEYI